MSSAAPPTPVSYLWRDGVLNAVDNDAFADATIEVADSWLVHDGTALALDLHRARFAGSLRDELGERTTADLDTLDFDAFWAAVIEVIPRSGDWFPLIELHRDSGAPVLVLRLRSAPARSESVIIISHRGDDPRTRPRVKGPDLASLGAVRSHVTHLGAGEVAILSPEGFIVEGAYSALLWWRGDTLCAPPDDLDRVDSVTARTVLTVAAALGIEVLNEPATPADLDGLEIWALSSLHGIRIVTRWIDGPQTAERPGRLRAWRARLGKLSRPLDTVKR